MINLICAGFFMFLYMGELQKNRIAAFAAGLVFMLCTILSGSRVTHQNVYSTIIWLPLILFFVQRYIRTGKRSQLLFSSAVMAIQFFAGFPQVMLYSSIFVFLYLIIFIDKSKGRLRRNIADIFLWIGAALLLAAVQLIPLAELVLQTGRAEVTLDFFSVLSIDYRILPMILFPTLFGGNLQMPFENALKSTGIDIEIYLGVIVACFLIYALIFYLKDKKIRVFIIFIILSLLYCMAGNIPGLRVLLWKIPVLGSFRVPSRMIFIYIFFAVVIFGCILSKLQDRKEAKRLLKFSLVMFAVFILVTVIVKAVAALPMASEEMKTYYAGFSVFLPTIIFCLCLIGVLAVYCYWKFFYTRKHAFAILAVSLGVLSILDIGRFSTQVPGSFDYYESLKRKPVSAVDVIEAQEDSGQFRSIASVIPEEMYNPQGLGMMEFAHSSGMHHQFSTYNAALTFEDQKANKFLELPWAGMPGDLSMNLLSRNAEFSASSIKYIADPNRHIVKNDVMVGARDTSVPFEEVYGTLIDTEDMLIYENKNAKPVINAAEYVRDMTAYSPLDVNAASYIENAPEILQTDVGQVAVALIEWKNNSVKAAVQAQNTVFINHAQSMYPGWNAYVDGEKVENYLVNGVTQGAYVPAGEHIVEFRFEPKSLYIGAVFTVAGIILLIFIAHREKRLRDNRSRDQAICKNLPEELSEEKRKD